MLNANTNAFLRGPVEYRFTDCVIFNADGSRSDIRKPTQPSAYLIPKPGQRRMENYTRACQTDIRKRFAAELQLRGAA